MPDKRKLKSLKRLCISTLHAGDSEQLCMFINYHLNQGVDHIYLFLDMPKQELQDAMPGHERLTTTLCSDDYWIDKFGHYPKSVEEKQRFVMAESCRLAEQDGHEFLMTLDTDELIFAKKSIHSMLSKFDAGIRSFALQVAEARLTDQNDIQDPFAASLFAVPDEGGENRELLAEIYGENHELMTCGFFGHRAGKSVYRLPFRYRSFNLHGPSTKSAKTHTKIEDDGIRLLHFDCGSLGTWKNKWAMRLSGATNAVGMGPARIKQRDRIREALSQSPAEQEACFKDFFALSAHEAKQLKARKLALEFKLDGSLFSSPLKLKGLKGVQTFDQHRTIRNRDVYQIAFACDSNFVQPSCACMLSFMDKVEETRVVVAYLLCDGIDEKDIQQIRRMENAIPNLTIIICDQTEKLDQDVGTHDLKRSTYSRLYLIDHVRAGRLLYIDSDMLVLKDISNLFSLDLKGNIIAGAIDSAALRTVFSPDNVPDEQRERLLEITGGRDAVLDYLNAGLLVLDMDHPEYLDRAQRCQALMRDTANPLKQRDQDAVNICFKGCKLKLDHSYNYMLQFFESKRATAPEIREYRAAGGDYRILHYSGKMKPWDSRADDNNFYTALYRNEVLRLEDKYGVSCNFEFSNTGAQPARGQVGNKPDDVEQILKRMLTSGRRKASGNFRKNADTALKRARIVDDGPPPLIQLAAADRSPDLAGSSLQKHNRSFANTSSGIFVDGEILYANDREIIGEVEYWIAGVLQEDIEVKLIHQGRTLHKSTAKMDTSASGNDGAASSQRPVFRFPIPRQLVGKENCELLFKAGQHDVPLFLEPYIYNGLTECTSYGIDGVCEKVTDEDSVRGWAYDRRKLDQALDIDIYLDGAFRQRVTASNYRADLEKSKVASGAHGFSIRLPMHDSQNGEHQVELYVANSGIRLRKTPIVISAGEIRMGENRKRRKKPFGIRILRQLFSPAA